MMVIKLALRPLLFAGAFFSCFFSVFTKELNQLVGIRSAVARIAFQYRHPRVRFVLEQVNPSRTEESIPVIKRREFVASAQSAVTIDHYAVEKGILTAFKAAINRSSLDGETGGLIRTDQFLEAIPMLIAGK